MIPHEVLGVEPGATEDEIRAAYRRLAQNLHPDKGGDPDRFMELKEAFNAMTGKDVEKRAREQLRSLYTSFLESGSPLPHSIKKALRKSIERTITEVRKEMTQTKMGLSRTRTVRSRLSEPTLNEVCLETEKRLTERLVALEDQCRCLLRVSEMIEGIVEDNIRNWPTMEV